MKNLLLVVSILSLTAVQAKTEYTTNGLIKVGNKIMEPEVLRAKIKHAQLKRTGGIIREANSAKGVFVVIDSQQQIPTAEISSFEPMIDEWCRVRTAVKSCKEEITVATVREAIGKAGGTVGVAVVESDDLPAFLTAPEDGWALVNARKLAADKPQPQKLAERIRKEILRGFAFVTGAAYMTKVDPLMRDVRTLEDLDRLQSEQFGLEIVGHLLKSSSFYGLKPWNQATYRQACEEGWAPAPTNDFQKAIWEKIRSDKERGPVAGLQIKP